MTLPQTKNEYEQLVDLICYHDRLYYQECSPEISDDAYDQLVCTLEETERLHPDWISPTSPSQRVSEKPLTGFEEVAHSAPMLSLEKVFSREEVEDFYDRMKKYLDRSEVVMCGELKLDGLAISVIYERGRFSQALTRGNGVIGSDVTHNLRTIHNLPLRVDDVEDILEIRGEVFLPKKAFAQLNEERKKNNEALWANPRNAAAGSLKLLDAREVAKRSQLSVCFYGIVRGCPQGLDSQYELQSWLRTRGFPTTDSVLQKEGLPCVSNALCRNVDEMMTYAKQIEQVREDLPFGIDGIVFKVDSIADGQQLGATAKHPRSACAFKFSAEGAWTYVRDITLQVGRTGVITPVAELEPVVLDGSCVARATLHNFDEMARKDIRVGDYVLVEKGGDVIPKVVTADATRRASTVLPFTPPTHCPSCGYLLVRDADQVAYRCPNSSHCFDQIHKRLVHFVGKDGLDIEHVGEKVVEQLTCKGFVKRPSDFFLLSKEQLVQLQGFKEKSITNVLESIQKAKATTLDKLLQAFGIRYVGAQIAEILSRSCASLNEIMDKTQLQFLEIPGIGEKAAGSLYDFFHSEEMQEEIAALLRCGVHIVQKTPLDLSNHFSHKRVVLTGTFHAMTRQEATKKLQSVGAHVGDTVTKKTDYVIVGVDAGSKLEKAKKLHIPQLTEEEFLHTIGIA